MVGESPILQAVNSPSCNASVISRAYNKQNVIGAVVAPPVTMPSTEVPQSTLLYKYVNKFGSKNFSEDGKVLFCLMLSLIHI